MTHYRPARQRRTLFSGVFTIIGLVFLAIMVLVWPTKTRQAKRLLASVAESLSCEGPITESQAASLRGVLQTNFSESTTIQIAGPEGTDGSFSRDQLLERFAELCAYTTIFRVQLSQVTVDSAEGGTRAQARADASIEYQVEGRTEHEKRLANFTLLSTPNGFQLTSVQVLPRVISQPEPRP